MFLIIFFYYALYPGAIKLGNRLRIQISQLLEQLKSRKLSDKDDEKQSELQLPAMQLLTSKNSDQAFFLRILKVAYIVLQNVYKTFCQIRLHTHN